MGQADLFIEYLFDKADKIDGNTVEAAKDCLADYLGAAYSGAASTEGRWTEYMSCPPAGKVPVLGYGQFLDGRTAASVNGFNAHCLEVDDGHRFSMMHPGSPVISSLISAYYERGFSKENLYKGIIMGYEAACRLGMSIQPSHKTTGFHATGTCGTVGAAIGTAFALGMNRAQMRTVLACAAGSAAGLLELQCQPSELKAFNAGRAAMDGLSAAYMGFTDFAPPDDVLFGQKGFLRLFGTADVSGLTEERGCFEIGRRYVKPYAACRHCHPAIEAMLELRKTVGADLIDTVAVETYKLAVGGHDHAAVDGTSSAKLSIPYSVAAAAVLGHAGVDAFSPDALSSEKILSLMKKITVTADEEFTRLSPGKRIARVTVVKKDGSAVSFRTDYAKGDPENPITRDELLLRIRQLVPEHYEEIVKFAY